MRPSVIKLDSFSRGLGSEVTAGAFSECLSRSFGIAAQGIANPNFACWSKVTKLLSWLDFCCKGRPSTRPKLVRRDSRLNFAGRPNFREASSSSIHTKSMLVFLLITLPLCALGQLSSISAGSNFLCSVSSTGNIQCFGQNTNGM